MADHEPGQRDEAGCGEEFLAQVVLDAVPDLFLGAQAAAKPAITTTIPTLFPYTPLFRSLYSMSPDDPPP